MKFTLKVRMIEERELHSEIPFLPEDDEYEMFLDALCEDISRIDAISSVSRIASTFQIEAIGLLFADVRELIKPAFTSSMIKKLRYVSLVEA